VIIIDDDAVAEFETAVEPQAGVLNRTEISHRCFHHIAQIDATAPGFERRHQEQLVLVTLPDRYERQVRVLLWCPESEHEVITTDPDFRVVQEVPACALAMVIITSMAALTNRMLCFLG
jgi:hypothetical protein